MFVWKRNWWIRQKLKISLEQWVTGGPITRASNKKNYNTEEYETRIICWHLRIWTSWVPAEKYGSHKIHGIPIQCAHARAHTCMPTEERCYTRLIHSSILFIMNEAWKFYLKNALKQMMKKHSEVRNASKKTKSCLVIIGRSDSSLHGNIPVNVGKVIQWSFSGMQHQELMVD